MLRLGMRGRKIGLWLSRRGLVVIVAAVGGWANLNMFESIWDYLIHRSSNGYGWISSTVLTIS